jgi:hypothetical protein
MSMSFKCISMSTAMVRGRAAREKLDLLLSVSIEREAAEAAKRAHSHFEE